MVKYLSQGESKRCVCGWAISGVHDARLGAAHISRAAADASSAYSILEHLKNVIRRVEYTRRDSLSTGRLVKEDYVKTRRSNINLKTPAFISSKRLSAAGLFILLIEHLHNIALIAMKEGCRNPLMEPGASHENEFYISNGVCFCFITFSNISSSHQLFTVAHACKCLMKLKSN